MFFNKKAKDGIYNTFLSKRLSHSTEILFELESVVSNTKKDNLETFDTNFELKDLIGKDINITDKRAVDGTDSKCGIFEARSARARFLL